MGIREEITPDRVLKVLGGVLLMAVILIGLSATYSWEFPTTSQIWGWFIDLVAIASLILTVAILSDLEEMQDRYLLRATIPNLQERLEERTKSLGSQLRSGFSESRRDIGKDLSKAEGILKQICDRVEGIDPEIHDTADDLRTEIRTSSYADEDEVYKMVETMHSINEQVKGLVEESKWKR